MKKLLIVTIMAAFALGACGKKQAPAKPMDKPADDKGMTAPAGDQKPADGTEKPAEPAK
jgi:hypothetical protein